MAFYLIGLGLNAGSITVEAVEALKKCKKIYLEGYTVNFPYELDELENQLNLTIIELGREEVEGEKFLEDANKQDIALLIYGAPLAATTHISMILKCQKEEIKFKIFENASIFDAISETGLQMYKFGKTASMPKWQQGYTPDSFGEIIRDNLKIKAHTLLLIDIGLELAKAKEQLRTACGNQRVYLDKVLVCSNMGSGKNKIYYEKLDNIPNEIDKPFCIVIPSTNLHELEKEALSELANI